MKHKVPSKIVQFIIDLCVTATVNDNSIERQRNEKLVIYIGGVSDTVWFNSVDKTYIISLIRSTATHLHFDAHSFFIRIHFSKSQERQQMFKLLSILFKHVNNRQDEV